MTTPKRKQEGALLPILVIGGVVAAIGVAVATGVIGGDGNGNGGNGGNGLPPGVPPGSNQNTDGSYTAPDGTLYTDPDGDGVFSPTNGGPPVGADFQAIGAPVIS